MLQEAQQARSNFLAGDVKPRYVNPFVQDVIYLLHDLPVLMDLLE